MVKILQINSTCNSGSTGRIAEDIGRIALEAGFESYISYGRNCSNSVSNTIRIGNHLGVYEHVIFTRLFDCHGLCSRLATRKFIRQVRELSPDIVHLHNIHGYYINYKILFDFLSKAQIPVVWTLHDCWSFTGHCAYFDFMGCKKWLSHCDKCPSKKDYPASFFHDASFRNWEEKKEAFTSLNNLTLVPVSVWLSDLISNSFLRDYPKVVIHNGIDLNVFYHRYSEEKIHHTYGINSKKVVLGVANVWSSRKGLNDFMQLRSLLDDSYSIILVGLSQKQLKQLPKGIIGIERTENVGALADLYSAADIFVNPTYEDNLPTTNLEAMACGCPVISYDTGGCCEEIQPGCGKLIRKGDIDGLKRGIEEICSENKNLYSQKCIQNIQENFRKEDRFKDYVDLYRSLLKI